MSVTFAECCRDGKQGNLGERSHRQKEKAPGVMNPTFCLFGWQAMLLQYESTRPMHF